MKRFEWSIEKNEWLRSIRGITEEEKSIMDSVEHGEWRSVRGLDKEKRRYEIAAKATLRKDKRVNIRMTERDLLRF